MPEANTEVKKPALGGRPPRNLWGDEDNARLRSLWRRGVDTAKIAEALGRPFGSVQTQLTRLGLRDLPRSSASRERIVELARDGWTISRIALQVGVKEPVVERVVLAADLVPRVLYTYARGRYGADLPLLRPGAPRPVLPVPVYIPAPKPDRPRGPKRAWQPAEAAALDASVLAGAELQAVARASGRTLCACYHRACRRRLLSQIRPLPERIPDLLARLASAAAVRPAKPPPS